MSVVEPEFIVHVESLIHKLASSLVLFQYSFSTYSCVFPVESVTAILCQFEPTSSKTADTSSLDCPTEVPSLTRCGKCVKSLSTLVLSIVIFIRLDQSLNQEILYHLVFVTWYLQLL